MDRLEHDRRGVRADRVGERVGRDDRAGVDHRVEGAAGALVVVGAIVWLVSTFAIGDLSARITEAGSTGLVVEKAGGAAARAGVQPGDLIVGVGPTRINTVEELKAQVDKSGKTVALLIEPDRPSGPAMAPSRVVSIIERSHGPSGQA